jgi:hypothetical protein
MQKLILTLTALVGLTMTSFASNLERIKEDAFGVYNKSDFHELMQDLTNNDLEAIKAMVLQGKVGAVEAGNSVYLMHVNVFGGLVQVRFKGTSESLWIPREASEAFDAQPIWHHCFWFG